MATLEGMELVSLSLPSTLVIRACVSGTSEDAIRHIGINSSMSWEELHQVLTVCFDFPQQAPGSPWAFSRGTVEFSRSPGEIGNFLAQEGDSLTYTYGLWKTEVTLLDIYPRDAGTPEALCIGGSGSFGHGDCDVSAINLRLTGRETTEAVLGSVRPPARSIIERSGMFDFVPLLQALDLRRSTNLDPSIASDLRTLPLEDDPAAVDAYWAMVLAQSSLGGEALANEIAEATMDNLGWEDDDGSFLTGPKIRALCPRSFDILAKHGAMGPAAKSAVERLDLFREILRA